ncbi:MAG TPA: PQQ-dependent sugar dehydrogenase [bacterium]|nr:PQQ-dependent sugar dehydrogenase [bacterium]
MHVLPLGAALVLLAAPGDGAAGPEPSAVPAEIASHARLVPAARGLKKPVGVVFAPGDSTRMFVVEQEGTIRVVEKGVPAATPFLDFRARVSTNHPERGLLGLAFHPRFAENGLFYVHFTDPNGDSNVLELKVAHPPTGGVDLTSERRILFVKQPYMNHNGGNLAFGPDGKLWVGLGDGGSARDPKGNGQNDAVLLAKMLRIDVDAKAGREKAPSPEIWGKGLRNPWRYSFDRRTGDLYVADVGQDAWEEVDAVPSATVMSNGAAAVNFGWKIMEGAHCFGAADCARKGLVLPVVEYSHKDGCSITGGYVYRGKALPALDGLYFYSDYCTAFLRSIRWKDGKAVDSWNWRAALDPSDQLSRVTAFGEDGDGELYIASHDGTIWKLEAAPAAAAQPSPVKN